MLRKQVVWGAGLQNLMGGRGMRKPCCAIAFNMESRGESVMGWTRKWHDLTLIFGISLWMQCENWLVLNYMGAGWLDRKLWQLSRWKMLLWSWIVAVGLAGMGHIWETLRRRISKTQWRTGGKDWDVVRDDTGLAGLNHKEPIVVSFPEMASPGGR